MGHIVESNGIKVALTNNRKKSTETKKIKNTKKNKGRRKKSHRFDASAKCITSRTASRTATTISQRTYFWLIHYARAHNKPLTLKFHFGIYICWLYAEDDIKMTME